MGIIGQPMLDTANTVLTGSDNSSTMMMKGFMCAQ